MKYAEAVELEALVGAVVRSSPLADRFNSVDVEPADYNDGGNFLRVVVHFGSLNDLSDEDVDAITSRIEEEVAKQDDRFPSVRFSEP